MALNERYVVGVTLGEYFVDKTTGLPLSDGTIEFFEDTSRTTPKNVFELSGSPPNYTYTALPNALGISSVGTPENASNQNIAIYFYPYDSAGDRELYYVVVKDSAGVIQFTREAWPNLSAADDPTNTENSISNEISNSQFVDVLFETDNGMVITFSTSLSNAVYAVAPGWDMIISSNGSGTVTINRTALAGSLQLATNPPYTLDIIPGGANISSLKLRQRLDHNPDIWAGGYIAGHMLISSIDGSDHQLSIEYSPSVAPAATTIVTGTTGASGYKEISATIELDAGTNTDDADTGYVDINIVMPVSGHWNVTSVQVVGLESNEQGVVYDQETVLRQEDHLFHYYNSRLQAKPTESYLVGWDFVTNPAQFGETIAMGAIGTNKSAYLWDQTIGYQSADSGFTATRSPSFGQLRLTADATTQVAIIQYLPQAEARALLSRRMSSTIRAHTSIPAGIGGTISLWYTKDASLPDVNAATNNSIVLTLDANGKPASRNGAWIEVERSSLGDATINITSTDDDAPTEESFTGWEIDVTADANLATFFAIVVGFASIDAADTIDIESVSLVPGDIPSLAPRKTHNASLTDCQYYYEKSYNDGVAPGAISNANRYAPILRVNSSHDQVKQTYFDIRFISYKQGVPVVSLYSTLTGTIDRVSFIFELDGGLLTRSSGGIATNPGDYDFTVMTESVNRKGANWTPNNSTSLMTVSSSNTGNFASWRFQYVADARLGII